MHIRKRHIVSFAALLAALAAIFGVWNYTPLVPNHVARLVTENLLRARGYRAELDAVRGTWRGEVVFRNPRIVALDDSSQVLLRAEALRVRPRRPWSLFRGRLVLSRVRLEEPRIELTQAPDSLGEKTAVVGPWGFPRLVIDAFEVTDARVTQRTEDQERLRVDHLDAAFRVRSRPRELRVTLQRARALLPEDSLRVEDLRATIRVRDDTLHVTDVQLRTGASHIEGQGRLALASRDVVWNGRVLALDLHEAEKIAHRHLPAGQVAGTVDLSWNGTTLEAQGRADGDVDGVRLGGIDYDLQLEADRIEIRRFAGLVNEGRVELTLLRTPGRGGLSGTVRVWDTDFRQLVPPELFPETLAKLPDHRITGSCRFSRTSDDSVHVHVTLDRSRIGNVPIGHAAATVAIRDRGASFREVQVESPLGRLQASGTVGDGRVEASFEAEFPRVESVLALAGRAPEPQGDVRISGRLSGPLDDPQVEAAARFGQLAARGAVFYNGTFGLWGWPLGRESAMDLEVRADSLQFRGHTLHIVGADVEYQDRVVHVLRSQANAGDTLIAAAFTVRPLPYDWVGRLGNTTRIDIETALLRIGEAEVRIEDAAAVWLRKSAVHVDSLQLVTRAGSLRLAGTFDAVTHQIDARADLERLDLGFLRHVLALSADITGSGSGWLEARGSLERTRIDARLGMREASFNGLPIDSLSVFIVGSETSTDIRELQLSTPYGSLKAGIWIGEVPSLARLLDPRRPAPSLTVLEKAPISAVLQLNSMQLRRLWLARGTGEPPPRWTADVSAFAAIGGTFGEPQVELRGWADRIEAATVRVTGARFDIASAGDSLVLRRLDVISEGQDLHVSARLPARLNLVHGLEILRSGPIQADLILPRRSFAIVDRFVPLFVAPPPGIPRGEVEGQVHIGGTVEVPQARGNFEVHGASFMLRDMEEVYRDVDATGEFDGKILHITSLHGLTGPKGTVRGEGQVEFTGFRVGAYGFKLQIQETPVYSVPDMTAIVTGELDIDSKDIRGKLVPNLGGSFDVLGAELRQEFESETTGGSTLETDVPEWMSNLALRAEKGNVWIRNSLVDAELAGSIRLVRTQNESQILGQVRVKRGTYSYLVHRFEITQGELDFSRNLGFNPELNIEGQTGRPGERLYVTLTGSAAAPQLSFRADRAEATSDDIQQQLLSVTGEGATAVTAATAVADYAEQVVRDLELASDISIDPTAKSKSGAAASGTTTQLGYNLSARQPISKDVFVVYTQGVRSDIEQRVSVEVDINRWLLMEAAYERRNLSEAGTNQSQNAYFLNLKYRHEY